MICSDPVNAEAAQARLQSADIQLAMEHQIENAVSDENKSGHVNDKDTKECCSFRVVTADDVNIDNCFSPLHASDGNNQDGDLKGTSITDSILLDLKCDDMHPSTICFSSSQASEICNIDGDKKGASSTDDLLQGFKTVDTCCLSGLPGESLVDRTDVVYDDGCLSGCHDSVRMHRIKGCAEISQVDDGSSGVSVDGACVSEGISGPLSLSHLTDNINITIRRRR